MGFFRRFRSARGDRVITCPETEEGAAVTLDALHAALTSEMRLASCTRWPERAACAQLCLSQIADSLDGCLVSSLVNRFYRNRDCALCGRAIGSISWHEAPPAVLKNDGSTSEWKDIPLPELAAVLHTGQPLCWYCNNIEEVKRMYPRLIVKRQRPVEKKAPLRSDNIY